MVYTCKQTYQLIDNNDKSNETMEDLNMIQ